MRLDQAVAARFPHISRRQARELIAQRRVLLNERAVSIASRQVGEDDRVAVVDAAPQIDIVKLAEEFVAVNKPAGMPTQPTRDRRQRSLEELLRVQFRSIYPVHRLDTGTSGIVVFARTRESAADLSALFAGREIRKMYLARVEGEIDHEMTIDSPIGGKEALTIVRPGDPVEAEIRTGRTHQIRIHLASIGHPVVGDRRYGGPPAPRLMLHAWKIEHQDIGVVEAPPPDDLIRSPAPWKPK
jgi:23S rRNA-/tRNA-specific pseudouridylate synthase